MEWLAQETHFVAYILKSPYPLLIAFNASNNEVVLPLPKSKVTWHHLVNTALHSPHDIAANLNTLTPLNESITLLPYSAVVARETL